MVHSFSGRVIGESKLRPLDIKTESEVFQASQDQILVRSLVMIQIVKVQAINTCYPFVIHQPWLVRTRFKNQEKELNHILRLYKPQENSLVILAMIN